MQKKLLIATALVGSTLGALVPASASAQSFGVYVGQGYGPGYYQPRYYDDDRRAYWAARERWEAHERWEREEARRRYWQHEREERARWWYRHHRDDDDD